MRTIAKLALLSLTVAHATALPAQDACSYDTCALRLENQTLVAGSTGERIARLPWLGNPDIAAYFAGSDSAAAYHGPFQSNYGPSTYLSLAGSMLLLGGAFAASSDDGALAVGLSLAGAAATIIGARKRNARRST